MRVEVLIKQVEANKHGGRGNTRRKCEHAGGQTDEQGKQLDNVRPARQI